MHTRLLAILDHPEKYFKAQVRLVNEQLASLETKLKKVKDTLEKNEQRPEEILENDDLVSPKCLELTRKLHIQLLAKRITLREKQLQSNTHSDEHTQLKLLKEKLQLLIEKNNLLNDHKKLTNTLQHISNLPTEVFAHQFHALQSLRQILIDKHTSSTTKHEIKFQLMVSLDQKTISIEDLHLGDSSKVYDFFAEVYHFGNTEQRTYAKSYLRKLLSTQLESLGLTLETGRSEPSNNLLHLGLEAHIEELPSAITCLNWEKINYFYNLHPAFFTNIKFKGKDALDYFVEDSAIPGEAFAKLLLVIKHDYPAAKMGNLNSKIVPSMLNEMSTKTFYSLLAKEQEEAESLNSADAKDAFKERTTRWLIFLLLNARDPNTPAELTNILRLIEFNANLLAENDGQSCIEMLLERNPQMTHHFAQYMHEFPSVHTDIKVLLQLEKHCDETAENVKNRLAFLVQALRLAQRAANQSFAAEIKKRLSVLKNHEHYNALQDDPNMQILKTLRLQNRCTTASLLNKSKAFKKLEQEANRGNKSAQLAVAKHYAEGTASIIPAKNPDAAAKIYNELAATSPYAEWKALQIQLRQNLKDYQFWYDALLSSLRAYAANESPKKSSKCLNFIMACDHSTKLPVNLKSFASLILAVITNNLTAWDAAALQLPPHMLKKMAKDILHNADAYKLVMQAEIKSVLQKLSDELVAEEHQLPADTFSNMYNTGYLTFNRESLSPTPPPDHNPELDAPRPS